MDLGTRNPTAILTIRYSGDRIHVEREHYQRGMSSDAITAAAEGAARDTDPDYLVVDPSAAGLIKSLEERGITVRKGTNDVKAGISRVTGALADLTVDPGCVNLVAEFESYVYKSGKQSENDAPVKANDHALDALRYAVMELSVPVGALEPMSAEWEARMQEIGL
jgi:phage terminase large subunit